MRPGLIFPFCEARELTNKYGALRNAIESIRFQCSETWCNEKQGIIFFITQIQQDSQQKHFELDMLLPFTHKSPNPWEELDEKLQWMVDSGIAEQYLKK
mmetsp:Transcript_3915/g.14823  ORF Transcript_3915/g.14823 Transcript_3915/m.14823 type:complete len:99 (+) Transcript_3915:2086-2382(+)